MTDIVFCSIIPECTALWVCCSLLSGPEASSRVCQRLEETSLYCLSKPSNWPSSSVSSTSALTQAASSPPTLRPSCGTMSSALEKPPAFHSPSVCQPCSWLFLCVSSTQLLFRVYIDFVMVPLVLCRTLFKESPSSTSDG